MKAASQVPSGVLISTSVSTTDAAPAAKPAAPRPAATDTMKSRRGTSRDSSLFLGSLESGIANLSSVTKYIQPGTVGSGLLRCTPAMAAGVTDRLWEASDLVALLEASERGLERAA